MEVLMGQAREQFDRLKRMYGELLPISERVNGESCVLVEFDEREEISGVRIELGTDQDSLRPFPFQAAVVFSCINGVRQGLTHGDVFAKLMMVYDGMFWVVPEIGKAGFFEGFRRFKDKISDDILNVSRLGREHASYNEFVDFFWNQCSGVHHDEEIAFPHMS